MVERMEIVFHTIFIDLYHLFLIEKGFGVDFVF